VVRLWVAALAVCLTATAAAAFRLGPGFVDRQRSAAHVLAVEGGDGRLGFLIAAHLHKAEALGPAGIPVHDHLRRLHGAMRLE